MMIKYKQILVALLAIIMVIGLLPMTVFAAEQTADLEISNATELKAFADKVNSGGDVFAGKTVVLTADIDLGGATWTPIGHTRQSNCFQGTFDGQGHTISNFKLEKNYTGKTYYVGFFGLVS